MLKFEGNINGKVYTDEKEFNEALAKLDKTDYRCISYRYVSVPGIFDTDDKEQRDNRNFIEYNKNIDEGQYVRNITNENDVIPEEHLINKLKSASNKLDIKNNVCKKIDDFTNKISSNLLHINELKTDYKKLEEKINLINSQIKTLDDANNNYYLNKEYYKNIKKALDDDTITSEDNEQKDNNECKCVGDNLFNVVDESLKHSFEEVCDIVNMTKNDLAKKLNIYNISDLVDYFLKKY